MKIDKKIILIVIILIILIVLYFIIRNKRVNNDETNYKSIPETSDVEVVATMNDELKSNTMWCGTFQLVWNDLINELVKQDIKFNEQLDVVDNLNKQDFNQDCISEKYYYKTFGLKTLDLKEKIEKGIKDKFNETSDILNDIDWSEDALDKGNLDEKRYLFYTMLKRNFLYDKPFTKLEDGTFAGIYDDVKYFGIDDSTEKNVRNQVEVLYYNSENDCAVLLSTKEGDQVILTRGINANTFNEIYEQTKQNADVYEGNKDFTDKDYLKIPEIEVSIKKKYEELENKEFYTSDGDIGKIATAIQSIQLKMDETGGSIKSEAAIDVMVMSAMLSPEEDKSRYFNFDDEFTMFLIEAGKDKPYFATHISDITKFQ